MTSQREVISRKEMSNWPGGELVKADRQRLG